MAGAPQWVLQRRAHAEEQVESRGLPQPHWEAWRGCDLGALTPSRLTSVAAPALASSVAPAAARGAGAVTDPSSDPLRGPIGLLPAPLCDAASARLLFVDGRLTSPVEASEWPPGVTVSVLSGVGAADAHDTTATTAAVTTAAAPEGSAAVASDQAASLWQGDGWAASHLGAHAKADELPLAALNLARTREVVVIHVAAGIEVAEPLLIGSYCSAAAAGQAVYPRVLLCAEPGSRIGVIEWCSGAAASDYLHIPVYELAIDRGARVEWTRLSEEGEVGRQFATLRATVQADGELALHSHLDGGAQVRADLGVVLAGSNAGADLSGLVLGKDASYLDHHTAIWHCAAETYSRQLFKGVLDESACGLFDGASHVAEQAQRIQAEQQCRNLLLSDTAQARMVPRLEIYADDVRCSHGATSGELDEQAIFYMRARGIDAAVARLLLTEAFAEGAIAAGPCAVAAAYQRQQLRRFLPGGEAL
ncbi:hypothetical protein CKO15_04210 [Halorhodospira abdelmalekii]|uniref:SufB/SufD family protein n=1 Tax=Halorhodospira abdelmalekii TaxID=421629 RepID=UPI001903686E|nr:SufD family Fe-S cluster assembly protein [Halorhodospira abdelmalekii]MBK1734501.1 hypothetical protein [Halorhodospira abdelmalekii]